MATSSLMLSRPLPQILDCSDHDRITENDRAEEGAEAGDGGALFEEPVDDERIQDEDQARQHPAQADVGMFVVVTAAALRSVLVIVIVFVLAQQ